MNASTITADQLYKEIQQLPPEELPEVANFVKFLRFKLISEETQLQSQKVNFNPVLQNRTGLSFYVHPQQALMQREVDAFELQHEFLWKTYPNQFIAMKDGQVVDYNQDELALLERIEAKFPDQIVLIRQVTASLPGDLVLRSPRFAL